MGERTPKVMTTWRPSGQGSALITLTRGSENPKSLQAQDRRTSAQVAVLPRKSAGRTSPRAIRHRRSEALCRQGEKEMREAARKTAQAPTSTRCTSPPVNVFSGGAQRRSSQKASSNLAPTASHARRPMGIREISAA